MVFRIFLLHFLHFSSFFPYFNFVLIFSLFLQHSLIEFKNSDRANAKHDGIDVHNRVHFMCNEIIKFVAANDDIEMHTIKEKI